MSNPKESVVLFPYYSGMGHLIPMIELAKLFINHNFSITILITNPPDSSPINSSFISRISDAYPSISFHLLPNPSPSPVLSPNPRLASLQLLRHSNPLLSTFLSSSKSTVRALVLDMFCTSALDVARELGIPSYIFFASGASVLSAFVLTPAVIRSQAPAGFRDLGETPLHFPGLPPIPASHMPVLLQDRNNDMCEARVYDFERLPMADGIVVNTFEEMERRAVVALADGSCFPGRPMPPVYCVGPLVGRDDGSDEKHECLMWLDAQPRGSVVFLSFGSVGAFSKEQLDEIAMGLERSGQRFLWVVRRPPSVAPAPGPELDLDELLPEGFLERTRGRGMVVKSWAPQAAVLEHKAVGGFVTHCGWNSILEAVCNGVPMIAWPMYAEQRMNKVFLVEEAKLAVELKGYDKEMVSAEEVEMKVRWLMESEGGRELKDQAAAMKEAAVAAREEGGSSDKKWMELVSALKKGC